jgi:two-component system, NtrC family, sensor kinase
MKKPSALIQKTVLVFLFLVHAYYARSQNKTIDSLKRILQTQKEDTVKVNTLNVLSAHVIENNGDFKDALKYVQESLSLANKLGYKEGSGNAYYLIGKLHFYQSNYPEALRNSFTALKIYEQSSNNSGVAKCYSSIGYIYHRQNKTDEAHKSLLTAVKIAEKIGDKVQLANSYLAISDVYEEGEENYPEALKYCYLALKIFEEIKDKRGIGETVYGIGWQNYKQGNYAEALNNYYRSLKLHEELSHEGMIAILRRSIGEILFLQGNYKEALKHEIAALKTFEEKQTKDLMAWTYLGIGNIYEGKGELTLQSGDKITSEKELLQAMKYYFLAFDTWEETKSKINISNTSIHLANLNIKLNNVAEAKKYLQKNLQLLSTLQSKEQWKKHYQSLSRLDSSEGNYKQAFGHYKKFIIYRDSLANDENTKKVLQLTFQYETDKKEAFAKAEQLRKEADQQRDQNRLYLIMAFLGFLVLIVVLIAFIQWRHNNQKKKANQTLQKEKEKVEYTLNQLKATQQQLIQSEKMASLGELTAGIAHEIQNPLNFVNNFSDVNKELLTELKDEIKKGNIDEVSAIADDVISNEEKINHHGKRADAIVKGMLQHSRTSSGVKEPTDINALCDEYLRLSYHGLRAKDKSFNATMKTDFDNSIGNINIIPQDIGRVILNLINNAFYAVDEKKKKSGSVFEPTVTVSTKRNNSKVEINVTDNGSGIPQKVLDKIFQPFFTTKPTGQGTGLGLSLSYDIVKAHGGELKVETKEGEGSEFTIAMPGA